MLRKTISRVTTMLLAVCLVLQMMPALGATDADVITLSFISKDTTKSAPVVSATYAEYGWEVSATRTSESLYARMLTVDGDHSINGGGLVARLLTASDGPERLVIGFDVPKTGEYSVKGVIGSMTHYCAPNVNIAIDGTVIATEDTKYGDFAWNTKQWGNVALSAGRHYITITNPGGTSADYNRIYLEKIELTYVSDLAQVITFGTAGDAAQLITEATVEANGWAIDAANSHENVPYRGSNPGYSAFFYVKPEGYMCANLLKDEYMALKFNVAEAGNYNVSAIVRDGGDTNATGVVAYIDSTVSAPAMNKESLRDGSGWEIKDFGQHELAAGSHILIFANTNDDAFGTADVAVNKLILEKATSTGGDDVVSDKTEVIFGTTGESSQLITDATVAANGWAIDATKSHENVPYRGSNAGYSQFFYVNPQGYMAVNLLKDEYMAITFNVPADGKYAVALTAKDGASESATDISVYMDNMDSAALISGENLRDGNGLWEEKALGEIELTAGNHTLIVKNSGADEFGTAFVYLNKLVLTRTGDIEKPAYEQGDVNGDGKINTRDVTTLRRYLAGGYEDSITFIPEMIDVNGDDRENTRDVAALRAIIAG